MIIQRFIAGLALLSILGSAPAGAAAPLQPSGKWTVDFGDSHCIAMRDYGTPAAPLILALKPAPIGDVMQLSVLRKGGKKEVGQYDGTMRVDRLPPVPVSILGFTSGTRDRVNAINLPLASFAPVRAATTLRIASIGEGDQSFVLSDMAMLTRTLDRCVADLRRVWNIGEAESAIRIPATSKKELRSLFGQNDYPGVALTKRASGVVDLMTLIDEAGKVASCMVIGSSGYASLDAQSCAIVTARAQYVPAIGTDGKPTRSGKISRIRWKLGD